MRGHTTRRASLATLGLGLGWPLLARAGSAGRAATGTLTVAAFPALDEIMRAALPSWNALYPGVAVKVVSRQASDHHTAMTTAMSTASKLPDLMAVEVGYIGRFAQGHGLEDLRQPPFHIDSLRPRFVPYALQQATNARGEVVGVPSDIGPGTLLYRHDLLAQAGLDEDGLIRTWEGFVEAGRRIRRATGAHLLAHARDMKDILIRTGIGPGEGWYFGAGNAVLVNTPRFVRAFELAAQIRRDGLDARVGAWSSDWTEGFRRGTIATQMMGAWLAGHMSNWLAPTTKGLWRAAQLPGGAFAAYGGSFFALPRGGERANKALAWQLALLLTTQRALQLAAFRKHDAFPALVESFDDPFFAEPIAFLGGQPARLVWRDAARRISAVAVHKQDRFAEEVVNTELDKVLLRGKDVASALGDAERLLQQRAHR
jgi:multiple sugar transport system substrate-binding protein